MRTSFLLRTPWFLLVLAACAPVSSPATAQTRKPNGALPLPAAAQNAVLPAVPAAPTVEKGSLPPAGAPVAGPLRLEAAAPDARWLVVCQARSDTDGDGRLTVTSSEQGEARGDRMLRYLEFASGEEQIIDELLARSEDGRWLVLKRTDTVELYDTLTGARSAVSAFGADTRTEPHDPVGVHRTLVFGSEALFYVRISDASNELIMKQLADGSERVLYTSPDPIARVHVDPAGKLISLSVARAENAKGKRFVWPYRLEDNVRECRGPKAPYVAPNPNADVFSSVVVDIEQARGGLVETLAGTFGASVIRRNADGSLWAVRTNEKRAIADKNCGGRVLWSDATNDVLLVGCAIEKRPGRLNVEVVTRAQRKSLDIEVALLGDEPTRPSQRLVALYPGADCVLFDVQKQVLHRLQAGDAVLSSYGARALVRRSKNLLLFDAEAGELTPLPTPLDAFGDVLVTGALVFASPWLVDLESGRVRGRVAGKALALSTSGAVLVPAVAATDQALDEGPLTWRLPE
ncbi:MAG: hypothetical protein ACOY0T_36855 [Myxococcota bacterium]